jgi:hypothetical protein
MINEKKVAARVIGIIVILWVLLTVLLFVTGTAHATTTAKGNSIGYLPYVVNPIQYLAADIIAGDVHDVGAKYQPRYLTTVKFHPLGTFMNFDETFTFCGDQAEAFDGHDGTVVLAFSSVMHRRDCYDLYSVYDVTGKIEK